MDINDLESVCAVDICHNYSEAAESIASSPAVISKHIAKIEKELGLRIFERASKSRPVELTPAGKELITYFHSIVGLYKQMSTRDMFPLLHDETFFFSCAQQDTPLSDRQRNQICQLLGFKNDMKVRFVDFNEPTIALKLVESGAGLLPQACAVPRRIGTVNFVPVENDTIRTGLYYIQRRNISCPALRKLRKCVHEFVGKYS